MDKKALIPRLLGAKITRTRSRSSVYTVQNCSIQIAIEIAIWIIFGHCKWDTSNTNTPFTRSKNHLDRDLDSNLDLVSLVSTNNWLSLCFDVFYLFSESYESVMNQ